MIIPLILQQIDMVDSDLKVGSSNAEGVYVKDTQLLQFDWSKLYTNLSYVWPNGGTTGSFPVIIANLSSDPVLLQRDGETEEVAPGKIDWYTIGGQGQAISEISLFNEDANGNGSSKRVVQFYSTMYAVGGDTNTYIGSCTFDNTVNFDYASTDYIMIPVTYSNLFDDTGVNYKPCVAYISGYISNADTGRVTFRVWNLGVDSDIMEYSGDVLSIKAIKIKD